jgi:hypothetical protein
MSNDDKPAGIEDVSIRSAKELLFQFALQHGPWAFLALILIAAMLGWIQSPLKDQIDHVERTIVENRAEISKNRFEIMESRKSLEAVHEYQNILLRLMCRELVPLQKAGTCEPKYRGWTENGAK